MEENQMPDCIEGAEAFDRFDNAMSALLSVPKDVINEREKEYRAKVDANQKRRGPKRKSETKPAPMTFEN